MKKLLIVLLLLVTAVGVGVAGKPDFLKQFIYLFNSSKALY